MDRILSRLRELYLQREQGAGCIQYISLVLLFGLVFIYKIKLFSAASMFERINFLGACQNCSSVLKLMLMNSVFAANIVLLVFNRFQTLDHFLSDHYRHWNSPLRQLRGCLTFLFFVSKSNWTCVDKGVCEGPGGGFNWVILMLKKRYTWLEIYYSHCTSLKAIAESHYLL